MKNFKNIFLSISAIVIFALLKFWYSGSTNEDLLFLLKPINGLVNIATGSSSTFKTEIGYINENLNIIINKTCSGFNFLLIVFLMLTFLMIKHFPQDKKRFFILPSTLILSYGFTILVTVSRIILQVVTKGIYKAESIYVHQVEGTFMYVCCLMLLYLSVDYFLKNRRYGIAIIWKK